MASPKKSTDNTIKGGIILVKLCDKPKENYNEESNNNQMFKLKLEFITRNNEK